MAHILVVNRLNHMGDAMCQMRGLKEYKDQHPEDTFDFLTCEYLHFLVAMHTDLFESVKFRSFDQVNAFAAKPEGYDRVIEFSIDWSKALDHGILKAWTETTLGFTPSTDQPYYLVHNEERLVAVKHAEKLRHSFRKLVLLQLNAPSGLVRSFLPEDWDRILDLFPSDVGIVYPGPIDLALSSPMKPRANLILLPGYDIGTTGGLINEVDYVFGAHGGTIMLAHAVGKHEVTQVMFLEGGSKNILFVPEWDNLNYPSNKQIDWKEIEQTIARRLE